MPAHGFQITKDCTDPKPNKDQTGRRFSTNKDIAARLKQGEGDRFRLLDSDGEVYFEGTFIGDDADSLAPLDWGSGYAGCTDIQYANIDFPSRWETR